MIFPGKLESLHALPQAPHATRVTHASQTHAQGGDSVKLTIGYHQLEGKRVPLKKPYAILDRAAPGQQQQAEQQPQQREGQSALPHAGYKVIGVVRSKLLFKTRPRALISKPANK